MLRTVSLTLLAGAIALALDLVIAAVGTRLTRVPHGFPPFSFLPILSGTVGGAVLASIVYSALKLASRNPDRMFFFVTLGVFALSLGLPLRLSFTHSVRFAGVTPSAQMVLVLMHAVVAAVSFVTLTATTSKPVSSPKQVQRTLPVTGRNSEADNKPQHTYRDTSACCSAHHDFHPDVRSIHRACLALEKPTRPHIFR